MSVSSEEYTYFYCSTVDTVLASVYGGFGKITQFFFVKVTSDAEVDTLSVVNVHVHSLWATLDATSQSPEKVTDTRE